MEKTLKINKIQGVLLVVAGIVLISAMCFGVVFANFAITDKVAKAEELPVDNLLPDFFNTTKYFDSSHVYYYVWMDDFTGEEILSMIDEHGYVNFTSFDIATHEPGSSSSFSFSFSLSCILYPNGRVNFSVYSTLFNTAFYVFNDGSIRSDNALSYSEVRHYVNGIYFDSPSPAVTSSWGLFLLSHLHFDVEYDEILYNQGHNSLVSDYNSLVVDFNTLESDYNTLENQFNSLLENYNNLVESTQYITVANNSGSIYTGEFGTYGSDLILSSHTSEGVAVTLVGRDTTSPYEQVLAFINLGDTFFAGSKFKFTYQVLTSFDGPEHIHLGVIHDGTIHDIFVTSSDNEINENFYTVEFVLPYDTSTFVLYSTAHVFAISAFSMQVLTNATQALIDSAYQRGVDSVNVNAYIQQGYDAGYYAGLSEENPYTFRSLMGAVVDAPLDVFTQMFDFDIMGVNMKTLYLSLFTLGIVLIVLKFALGRL